MNTYYLIRHGQDQDNAEGILNGHRDRTLTETGISQAIELATKIRDRNLAVDHVLSSPLNRAFTTASIISGINKYPTPVLETLLIERDFGVMTGQKQSDIVKLCTPDVLQTGPINYFLSPKSAETFPDLINRGKNLLEKLSDQFQDKIIILVSHGDFGKMLYAAFYNLDWKEALTSFRFGNSELILLKEGTDLKDTKLINIEQYNV